MNTVTSADGTTIAFDRSGARTPLILIDGAMSTRSGSGKSELVELLARQFSVCSYDRRGRGGSGNTLPYAVEREIEDVEALIDAGGGTACLYGHSSGGCLALEAARNLVGKVDGVAVYEAPYNDDPAAQEAWGEYIRQLGTALAEGPTR